MLQIAAKQDIYKSVILSLTRLRKRNTEMLPILRDTLPGLLPGLTLA